MALKYLIGIDEAGRGPIAGPVAVGAVCWKIAKVGSVQSLALHTKAGLPLRDSKKLTARQREAWFDWLGEQKVLGGLNWTVSLVEAGVIDRQGIVLAIRQGIDNCLQQIASELAGFEPETCQVLLDGSLRAPLTYVKQKTIIRGDESEPIISLASIAAKVTRDNFMIKLGGQYPHYGFERHKGYGTKDHYQRLAAHGPSSRHRLSFLTRGGII